jgi:acetyltransferase-like isoleucine patch superfamily enzyme
MSLFDKILNLIVIKLRNHNLINLTGIGQIHSRVKLKGAIITGNVIVSEGCKIVKGVHIKGESEVRIGKYTSINGPMTDIHAVVNSVTIGAFCSIARNVTIQEYNHRLDGLTTYFINQNIFEGREKDDIISSGSIEIGNDVWVGTQTVILSGAKIGDGAIIGANSVVTGVIPPYSIAVGSPAKVIKYRFDQDTIDKIQELKWWNWDIEKIKINKNLFIDFKIEDLYKAD